MFFASENSSPPFVQFYYAINTYAVKFC